MYRFSRNELNRRNDMMLIRHAEDQAFECFQVATVLIAEGNKSEAAAQLKKAMRILEGYRSPVKMDLCNLLNSISQ